QRRCPMSMNDTSNSVHAEKLSGSISQFGEAIGEKNHQIAGSDWTLQRLVIGVVKHPERRTAAGEKLRLPGRSNDNGIEVPRVGISQRSTARINVEDHAGQVLNNASTRMYSVVQSVEQSADLRLLVNFRMKQRPKRRHDQRSRHSVTDGIRKH